MNGRFGRPALTWVFMVGLYYLLPIEPGVTDVQLAVRAAGTFGAGLLVTGLILRQVRNQMADPARASLADLGTALVGGVMFFALADYVTAVWAPGQFADLRTKTDALYFALATLTTVGYGDVRAAGQVGRAVVVVQLVFNVVVVTTGASVLTRQLGTRIRERRTDPPPR